MAKCVGDLGTVCLSHTSSRQGLYVTLVQSLEISALDILHQGKLCMWPWCSHWKFLPFTYFIKARSVCDLGAVIGKFCPSHTSSSDGKVCGQPQYSLPFTYFINWWQSLWATSVQSAFHILHQLMAKSVGNLSTVCLSHTSSSDGKVCGWYRYSLPIRYFIKAKYIGDLCAVIRTFYPSHTSSTDGGVCGWPRYSLPFTYFIKVKYVGDLTSVQSALHILHQSELCRWPLCSHRNILPFTYFKWWRSLWAASVQSVLHILHQGEVCMWRQCSHQKVVPFRYICSWWQGELVTEAIWSGMRCVPWNIQRWMLQYFVFVILLSTPFSDEDGIFWSLPQVL